MGELEKLEHTKLNTETATIAWKEEEWIERGELLRSFDEQAARRYEEDAVVWGIIFRPWLLVQASHLNAH